MIMASFVSDGGPGVILGLSRKNCELLLEGRPIPVDLEPLIGIKIQIVLTGGETEEAIARKLERHYQLPDGALEAAKAVGGYRGGD